jgi:uncharacterized protein YcbK (DUF882 family)
MIMPHVRGHIKVRVLSYIDQVFLGGGVGYYYPTLEIVGVDNGFIRPWAILIS